MTISRELRDRLTWKPTDIVIDRTELSASLDPIGIVSFPVRHSPTTGRFVPSRGGDGESSGVDPDAPHMYVDDIRDSVEGHLGEFDSAEVGFIRDTSHDQADIVSRPGGKIREVSINEGLHTPQSTLDAKRVRQLIRNPKAVDEEIDNELPVVVRLDGKLWMGDGHHRAVADMVRRGSDPPTFRAYVVEED